MGGAWKKRCETFCETPFTNGNRRAAGWGVKSHLYSMALDWMKNSPSCAARRSSRLDSTGDHSRYECSFLVDEAIRGSGRGGVAGQAAPHFDLDVFDHCAGSSVWIADSRRWEKAY